MSHLEEKLAEFVFGDLPESEMESARQHLAQCLECQGRVAGFQKAHRLLEQVPEVDVPRRMVFLPSAQATSKRRRWRPLTWGIPSAVAAALFLAVLLAGQLHFERNDSGFVFQVGRSIEVEPQAPQAVQLPAVDATGPVAPVIVYEDLDYEQIVDRLRADQEAWLGDAVDHRIAAVKLDHDQEFQRVRAELLYLSELQRAALRDTYQNASSIQLLASRTEGE